MIFLNSVWNEIIRNFSHFNINVSSSPNRLKEIFPAQYVKRVTNIWPDNSPWRAVGDFCGLEKEVFILTPVSAVPNFTHSLLKEERTMSTSPMMMIVWQKSSPLSRASTAIASSVLSLSYQERLSRWSVMLSSGPKNEHELASLASEEHRSVVLC